MRWAQTVANNKEVKMKAAGYRVEINLGGFREVETPGLVVDREIFQQASVLDLDEEVMHEVQELYNEVDRKGLTKYKDKRDIVTALTYVVCRRRMIPLTLHKICDTLRLEYRSINKVYRYIMRRMGYSVPPTTPEEYVHSFAIELNLPKKAVKRAERIIEVGEKAGIVSGKGPAGIAAASLCLASDLENLDTSQKEVAEVSGVTQVTIRNRYRELEDCLNGQAKSV